MHPCSDSLSNAGLRAGVDTATVRRRLLARPSDVPVAIAITVVAR